MQHLIHTPEGVRDIYGSECKKKFYIEQQLKNVFERYGYEPIETPTFEYFEVFAKEIGTTPSKNLYKFFDRDGDTLVLRPDFTPSIARAFSRFYAGEHMPVRLYYSGNTFINENSYRGRMKESTQMGIELMNDASADADAEVIAMAVELMLAAGLKEFQISIGQVAFFKALAQEAQIPAETLAQLRSLISGKNHFAVEEVIRRGHLRADLEQAFLQLPYLFGGVEVLEKAKALTRNPSARRAVEHLEEIYRILSISGYEKYVGFDLGMLHEYEYYTGIIFQAVTYGTGEPIAKGGRYDRLLEHFDYPAPAVGFGLTMDSLLAALERQQIEIPQEESKTMILYPDFLRETGLRLVNHHRRQQMQVAGVVFDRKRTLSEYRAYGKRNHFGGIVYLQSQTEIFAINLQTEEVQPLNLKELLGEE